MGVPICWHVLLFDRGGAAAQCSNNLETRSMELVQSQKQDYLLRICRRLPQHRRFVGGGHCTST